MGKTTESAGALEGAPDPGRLGPCSRCGSVNGVVVLCSARGKAETHFDGDGVHRETNTDGVYYVPHSEAVRCIDCVRIRRDLVRSGPDILKVAEVGS